MRKVPWKPCPALPPASVFLRFILLYHFFCPFILLRVTPPLRLSFCFTVTCVTPPLLLSLRLASSHTNTSLSIRLALCHSTTSFVPVSCFVSLHHFFCPFVSLHQFVCPFFTYRVVSLLHSLPPFYEYSTEYMAAVTEIKMQIVFILMLFNNMNKK